MISGTDGKVAIGSRMARVRGVLGVSAAQLERAVGTPARSILRRERENRELAASSLVQYADAFGVHRGEFFVSLFRSPEDFEAGLEAAERLTQLGRDKRSRDLRSPVYLGP